MNIRYCTIGMLICGAVSSHAATLYVSPEGNDQGNGSREAPLASLARARDVLREQTLATGTPGGEIVLLPGLYELSETVRFEERDGGTAAAPLVIRAAEPGTARLSGARRLPPELFQPVTEPALRAILDAAAADHILVVDLAAAGIALPAKIEEVFTMPFALPELFCDGQRMDLARWPDEGWATIEKIIDSGTVPGTANAFEAANPSQAKKVEGQRGGIFQYTGDQPARWHADRGLWLQGYWCYDYIEQVIKVANIDPATRQITLSRPHRFGLRQGNPSPRRWRAVNLLEELTRPGECFFDCANQRLYCWPPAPPATARLAVTVLRGSVLSFDKASHVRVQGLVVEESHVGISVDNSDDFRIEGCVVRNQQREGIRVNGGKEARVVGCDVHDTGRSGIQVAGGDRKTLTPAGHLIENCHIWRFALHQLTYAPAIALSGVGNSARHNRIHDAPHMAISLAGNDLVFEYNVVHDVCLAADDSAALYKGRDPSRRGNVVRHNFWYNIGRPLGHGNAAIYLDDGDGGEEVVGNVFFRCGEPGKGSFGTVQSHGGHDNLATDNVFIECKRALGSSPWNDERWKFYIDSELWRKRLLQDVDITREPYTTRYPALAGFMDAQPSTMRVNRAQRNLLVMCADSSSGNWQLDDSNWQTDEDPGFADIAKGDFRLKDDAAVFERIPGFQAPPFAKMGLYVDALRPVVTPVPWTQAPPRPLPPLPKRDAPPPARPAETQPLFKVRRTENAPAVNGVIEADEWAGRLAADAMSVARNYNGAEAARSSSAWLCHDSEFLYVAVANPVAATAKLDGAVWDDHDAVEFSIQALPPAAAQPIHIFRGYGTGVVEHKLADNGTAEPRPAPTPPTCLFAATRPRPDFWQAEIAIPLAALGIDPARDRRLAFNLTVRKGDDNLWLMWAPTRGKSYHVAAAGILELQP